MTQRLDWNLLLKLAAGGAVIGVLIGTGLLPLRWTFYAWIGLAFAWGVTIGRKAAFAPWRAAIATGAMAGFFAGDVLALLFYTDYANILIAANATGNMTADPTSIPRTGIVISSVINGTMFGLLAGFAAWAIGKAMPRPEPVDDSEE